MVGSGLIKPSQIHPVTIFQWWSDMMIRYLYIMICIFIYKYIYYDILKKKTLPYLISYIDLLNTYTYVLYRFYDFMPKKIQLPSSTQAPFKRCHLSLPGTEERATATISGADPTWFLKRSLRARGSLPQRQRGGSALWGGHRDRDPRAGPVVASRGGWLVHSFSWRIWMVETAGWWWIAGMDETGVIWDVPVIYWRTLEWVGDNITVSLISDNSWNNSWNIFRFQRSDATRCNQKRPGGKSRVQHSFLRSASAGDAGFDNPVDVGAVKHLGQRGRGLCGRIAGSEFSQGLQFWIEGVGFRFI